MTRFAFRATFLAIKGVACLIGGLLFGALPLLIVIAWKCLKGGVKVTMWTIGAALFIVRSV